MTSSPEAEPETLTPPLVAERLQVTRCRVETGLVRVATVTREREYQVDEELTHERFDVRHVPVGRTVDALRRAQRPELHIASSGSEAGQSRSN